MIDIYLYHQTLNLFQNSLTHLGNTLMFNDKIKLYKNLNTPINFKIRDRDRVTMTPSQVLFTILDSNKVKVLQTYLDFVENGKYFTITIGGALIEQLKTGRDYYFMLSTVNDDSSESPLYVDHTFGIHGSLWVEEASTPVFQELYTDVVEIELKRETMVNFVGEKTRGNTFNQLVEMNSINHTNLFRISETFNVGDNDIEVGLTDSNTTPILKTVYVLKHTTRHYPIDTEKQGHWDIVQVHNEVSNKIVFDKLRNGHYMICFGIDGADASGINCYRKYIQ